MKTSFDVIVVGMGIVGMAHAYTAAKQGLRVLVADVNHHAAGVNVRNLGFITVPGQKEGEAWQYARRSAEI